MFALLLCLISFARRALDRYEATIAGKVFRKLRGAARRRRLHADGRLVEAPESPESPMSDEEEIEVEDGSSSPLTSSLQIGKKPRSRSVIDSIGDEDDDDDNDDEEEQVSTDQVYGTTPESVESFRPEWLAKRSDLLDANMRNVPQDEEVPESFGSSITARMPVHIDAEHYNMSHKNRGRCVVFNHEEFETGFASRAGSSVDAKRIERTFQALGFTVEILNDLCHSDVIGRISDLSEEDHTDNDCICIFLLTHGLNNDMICAKDVAYKSDSIWKPFTADKCRTLAGKPKLFFFQACRGDKVDGGIMLRNSAGRSETDSIVTSYKIPTHADFLIAHSAAQDFVSWRNPDEGTWYIQSLCDVLDNHAQHMDLARMLTLTARKVATEFASYHDLDPTKHEMKQVPSVTSMLIREIYFQPK